MKCTDVTQIFDFYTKLRIILKKGGVYIIPLEEITRNNSIVDVKMARDESHVNDQSNALYTILTNEDVIPQDFTMAQNRILSYSETMDGFRALRGMLKTIHPTLTKKRPPENAPKYSQYDDLNLYEQGLRHHYKLHYLFNGFSYSDIEKSRQFLRGLDSGNHNDAIMRIRNQLDLVESQDDIKLDDDYRLENLASTINNMLHETQDNVVVNAMRMGNQHSGRQFAPNRGTHRRSTTHTRRYNSSNLGQKYTKMQCFACKTFGHRVHDCTLLPKVLAILQFANKEKETCSKILQKYTSFNTVDNKKAIVRALQQIGQMEDDDSDTLLEEECIVHSAFTNLDDDWIEDANRE